MRRIIHPTDCALALCGLFLWAPIASGQGLPRANGPRTEVTNYLFCVAGEGANQSTLYYSSDFVTTGQNIRPVQEAFLGFLRQRYSYRGNPAVEQPVQCTDVHSVEESRSVERIYINRDRQNKIMVVETGWVYGSASADVAPAASSSDASKLTGVYLGKYRCSGGDNDLKLTVRGASNGSLTALFTFTAVRSMASYSLAGRYDGVTGQFKLEPDKWVGAAPSGYNMVGMDGVYDAASNKLSGKIASGACGPFSVVRDNAQTADAAAANPATPAALVAPAPPATPRTAVGRAPVTTVAPAPTRAEVDPQLAQDPRLAQLSPEYRQFALSEVPRSKTYCENNAMISALMDCTCFAKIVLDYRIAHAGETVRVPNARRGSVATPSPLINVIGAGNLNCSQCLTDDKIMRWVAEQARPGLTGVSPARSQKITDCASKAMATRLKAQPDLQLVRPFYDQALVACVGAN
ncbi:MAG TPA: hypothetical protein VEV17_09055 [Bryobacteraceae bacterium]|nr:hypothetical protein [Bryobacteraceae bacterium]